MIIYGPKRKAERAEVFVNRFGLVVKHPAGKQASGKTSRR